MDFGPFVQRQRYTSVEKLINTFKSNKHDYHELTQIERLGKS